MGKPRAFITSVRVDPSNGPHEWVTVFIRGQCVGTLCVGNGDGAALKRRLLAREAQPNSSRPPPRRPSRPPPPLLLLDEAGAEAGGE
jgi:hypothetical protein